MKALLAALALAFSILPAVCGCDDGEMQLLPDAAAAAADAALPDAAAADAAPPDAVPCGAAHETCCRVGESCQPGLGCIGGAQSTSECVPLADGGAP